MKAYKLEILIVDHDEVGIDEIVEIIESARYPNRCIHPHVMASQEADIGEWTDEHPLNALATMEDEYRRIFNLEGGRSV